MQIGKSQCIYTKGAFEAIEVMIYFINSRFLWMLFVSNSTVLSGTRCEGFALIPVGFRSGSELRLVCSADECAQLGGH